MRNYRGLTNSNVTVDNYRGDVGDDDDTTANQLYHNSFTMVPLSNSNTNGCGNTNSNTNTKDSTNDSANDSTNANGNANANSNGNGNGNTNANSSLLN
ncbi:hypothetical protein PoB_006408300 [Plakobranchus ocellatus]|uniref:Uncharacterized protein n=1 Tax=Plakobranchus ocellatus TaxID=259542 RepID=A0AAV4D0C0_9GAST|nr:hypothetical protein PoB_006408300 [Plakobranchus ocellatus]